MDAILTPAVVKGIVGPEVPVLNQISLLTLTKFCNKTVPMTVSKYAQYLFVVHKYISNEYLLCERLLFYGK